MQHYFVRSCGVKRVGGGEGGGGREKHKQSLSNQQFSSFCLPLVWLFSSQTNLIGISVE